MQASLPTLYPISSAQTRVRLRAVLIRNKVFCDVTCTFGRLKGLTALGMLWIFRRFTTTAQVSSSFWDVTRRRLVVVCFGTDMFWRNFGTQLRMISNIPEEQRYYLQRDGNLKSLSITGVDHEVEEREMCW